MEVQPQANADELIAALRGQFEQLCRDVTAAVNEAPAGRVITDSEEKVRDLLARFRQQTYQAAVQLRLDAAQAASPLRGTPPAVNASRARAATPSPSSPSTAASPCPADATSPRASAASAPS